MPEFKELVQATLVLMGYLVGWVLWAIMILLCVVLVVSLPIFAMAGIYKIICLICHMTFRWEFPIFGGLAFLMIFGMVGLDDDYPIF